MNRGVFREELAVVLQCRPTPADLRKHSARFPDRWGQLVAILARCSGFTEKLEVDGEIAFNVAHLSDAELSLRLADAERKLAALRQIRALPAVVVEPAEQADNPADPA